MNEVSYNCCQCNLEFKYLVDQYYDTDGKKIYAAFCHFCKDFGFMTSGPYTGRPICGDHCTNVVDKDEYLSGQFLPLSCCLDCLPKLIEGSNYKEVKEYNMKTYSD